MAVRNPSLRDLREAVTDDGVRVREGAPLDRAGLAAAAGCSPQMVSAAELGTRHMSKPMLDRLARALGVSLEEVVKAAVVSREQSIGRKPQRPRGTHARRARGPVGERERRTR